MFDRRLVLRIQDNSVTPLLILVGRCGRKIDLTGRGDGYYLFSDRLPFKSSPRWRTLAKSCSSDTLFRTIVTSFKVSSASLTSAWVCFILLASSGVASLSAHLERWYFEHTDAHDQARNLTFSLGHVAITLNTNSGLLKVCQKSIFLSRQRSKIFRILFPSNQFHS